MLHRMKTAGEYQKKAIRALFPDGMKEHLDVIEKEIKSMVMETVEEMKKDKSPNRTDEAVAKETKKSNVKKVDIG